MLVHRNTTLNVPTFVKIHLKYPFMSRDIAWCIVKMQTFNLGHSVSNVGTQRCTGDVLCYVEILVV